MTDTFRRLGKAAPTGTPGAIYTVPAATQAIVRQIRCVNTDTVARPITLYESGTATGDIIEPTVTLQPGDVLQIDAFFTLGVGNFIAAASDAAGKVNVFVYGLEIGV
jgi:hypothetical protein